MALLRLVTKSLETAGHGIATGVTALVDEASGGRLPEVRAARRDQERRLEEAVRGVESNARVVGGDLQRIVGTTGVSIVILARVVTHPDQLRRIVELIETHDFPALVRALQHGARFPDDFFPNWIRRAGGYFPKFAQVLSVRADLIRSKEVLEQFGRCLEDMPARPLPAVREQLRGLGWSREICDGVGESLNAGTIAQVNAVVMPDGTPAVVKLAWPDTRRQMQTDFRLFAHARGILRALRLEDEQSHAVAAIFSAVGRSEGAVMQEFDMRREAAAMELAGRLCASEWGCAYAMWLTSAEAALAQLPPPFPLLATTFSARLRTSPWSVRVPQPLAGAICESALAMSLAGGESMHRLLAGDAGQAGQQEAAQVLIGLAIPFIGWLLLCRSTSDLAHVDPHPGNFRWDATSNTLWVLDWGSHVVLSDERRAALCLLVSLIASDSDDGAIADTAASFGIRCTDDRALAQLMRGMMNATRSHAAQDAINTAAIDKVLDDVSDEVVPVVRCLATLGGLLKQLQRSLREQRQQDIPLSLASLWAPFATLGLHG